MAMLVGCTGADATPTPPSTELPPIISPTPTSPSTMLPPRTSPTPTPPSTELPLVPYLPEVPRISVEEVKAKLDEGINMVIVDSRPKSIYEITHIVGAISLPVGTMAEPYSDLDGYDEITFYCL